MTSSPFLTQFATGRYANIRKEAESGRFVVSKGLDENKDRSYVLWGVTHYYKPHST